MIKLLEADGWGLNRQRGSHRHYRHPEKPGTVTIAGRLGDELKPGTLASHPSAGRSWKARQMSAYAVIIEGSKDSFSAYVPDLPGCVAAGKSLEEVEARIRQAIRLHIESLEAHGEPVPPPAAAVRLVDVT
jgi:predicted RNase H-like HicB family nuclease/predicted RNA binding protein YcfA (HicA-like mRNA interferase family)